MDNNILKKKKIILILKEDIINFPPVLSIIQCLIDLGMSVIHIGVFSDKQQQESYEKAGVTFLKTTPYNGNANPLKKLFLQLKFRHEVLGYIKNIVVSNTDIIWLIQSETIILLNNLVEKYNCILHQFEYSGNQINWKYKLLAPRLNLSNLFRKAYKVVSCEYNRAHITKGLFQLDTVPIILPNKMIFDEKKLENIPNDIKDTINTIKNSIAKKKMILYQGIFLDEERRLEEFCQAIDLLPEDYIFVAMGTGSEMYFNLKKKYESDRVLFIPFIRPPYHMLITKEAYIGVLTYFPRPYSINSVINPIYCAPNKIFEYAKYGIPMISNDIPALHYIFNEYSCGKCINYPMTPQSIASIIGDISQNYNQYSSGSHNYYESVNTLKIIKDIISI